MQLNFYMKSGSCLKLKGIKSYEFKSSGNDITYISLEYGSPARWLRSDRLLIGTINLSQIEAVTRKG